MLKAKCYNNNQLCSVDIVYKIKTRGRLLTGVWTVNNEQWPYPLWRNHVKVCQPISLFICFMSACWPLPAPFASFSFPSFPLLFSHLSSSSLSCFLSYSLISPPFLLYALLFFSFLSFLILPSALISFLLLFSPYGFYHLRFFHIFPLVSLLSLFLSSPFFSLPLAS